MRSRSNYLTEKEVTKYEIIEPSYERLLVDTLNENKLPKNLIPYFYQLYFIIDFEDFIGPTDYNSTVEIFFNCKIKTSLLILNAKYLEVNEHSILVNDLSNINNSFNVKSLATNSSTEFLTIEFYQTFESNRNYSVSINFKGFINNIDDYGLIRLSYFDEFGIRRY